MENVIYYRVSTKGQGESGLGLEAQQQIVAKFLTDSDSVIAEFTEVESGRKNDRIELKKAVELAKQGGARLVVAKLDRLARNVFFISALMESKVNFIAVDLPNANNFTVHLYAALAEQEAKLISERTKAALGALKARGVKLGPPPGKHHNAWGEMSTADKARISQEIFERNYAHVIPVVRMIRDLPPKLIAQKLNEQNYKTSKGGTWSPTQVNRVLEKL
jgi:DNA invertase Pin-like site-specific DNA recombinase